MGNFQIFECMLEIRNESIQNALYKTDVSGMRIKIQIDRVINQYYTLTSRGYNEALNDNGSPS